MCRDELGIAADEGLHTHGFWCGEGEVGSAPSTGRGILDCRAVGKFSVEQLAERVGVYLAA